jgi:phosphatidylglycerophosphate synthase
MHESLSRVETVADRAVLPLVKLLHEGLRMSPSQVSASSFVASVAAGVAVGVGHLTLGLGLMAAGQLLDGADGAIARRYGLASQSGARIDTMFDRASETAVFVGFALSGLAPARLVLLALAAILLLTSIVERSKIDLGVKRFALYFGHWISYPTLFLIIFAVNLTAYVVGLLKCDIVFQQRMDALGGDLDTVASRAAELELAERSLAGPPRSS